MAETFNKIDSETLEVINSYNIAKDQLIRMKEFHEQKIVEINALLDKLK